MPNISLTVANALVMPLATSPNKAAMIIPGNPADIGDERRFAKPHQQENDGETDNGIQCSVACLATIICGFTLPSGHNIAHRVECVLAKARVRAGKLMDEEKTGYSHVVRNEIQPCRSRLEQFSG